MADSLKTFNNDYRGLFYFLLMEKVAIIFFSLWTALLLSIMYMFVSYNSSGPVSWELKSIFLFFAIFAFLVIGVFTLIPAYLRARFLRNGGYCVVTPDFIESFCLGNSNRYEYKNRTIKVKRYKDGSADIFVGKSLIDVLKHGAFLFTPSYFKAWKAVFGIGAPLYRVTNADEVVKYLEANK